MSKIATVWAGVKFGPMNWIASFVMLVYFAVFALDYGYPKFYASFSETLLFLYSFVTLNLFFVLVALLSPKRRWIRSSLNLFFFVLLNLLFAYHLKVKFAANYSVIADNFALMFRVDSMIVILTSFGIIPLTITAIVVTVMMLADKKYHFLSTKAPRESRMPQLAVVAPLYLLVIIVPVDTYDEITYFLKTVHEYHFDKKLKSISVEENVYPYMNDSVTLSDKSRFLLGEVPKEKPHIIVIQVESYNGKLNGKLNENGVAYTPVLNQKMKEGLHIENYYSNSIQTAKGHFPFYNSVLPAITGKVYVDYTNIKLRSLPTILKENGWATAYYKANDDLTFDNALDFLGRNGFEDIRPIYDYMTEEEKDAVWGWGVEDSILYDRTFKILDRDYKHQDKPLFLSIITVANHMRFNQLPPEKMVLYKEPRNLEEHFANSIHLCDRQLQIFFDELEKREWLKNSIVVITGDHSYPLGDHGIVNNENGFYEESFKVPFLMLWNGVIQPRVITEKAYSHLDFAPSLLDLLGMSAVPNHFQGTSYFADNPEQPVHLIQPYSGKYLSVVNYPEKYTYFVRKKKSFLFNLKTDPAENHNIIDQVSPEKKKYYQEQIDHLYKNQLLLEKDLIWEE